MTSFLASHKYCDFQPAVVSRILCHEVEEDGEETRSDEDQQSNAGKDLSCHLKACKHDNRVYVPNYTSEH